jgi:hypothetical protein
MDSLYKAPEAIIRDTDVQAKTMWKVFAWITLLLEPLSVYLLLSMPEVAMVEVIAEVVVYGFIILGLFGFAYDKRFLSRHFWMLLIPVGGLYDIFSLGWDFDTPLEGYLTGGLVAVVWLVPTYFQYLALYRYSARSSQIWILPPQCFSPIDG